MAKQISTFLISLLTPGLGYLQIGDKKNFYRAITIFFTVFILGIVFRLFTSFLGLAFVIVTLLIIYLFAAIHSTIKAKYANHKTSDTGLLKLFFTISFLLITGTFICQQTKCYGF